MIEALLKDLRNARLSHMESLADGAVEDYPTYKELTGRIAGLYEAERIVADLIERAGLDAD